MICVRVFAACLLLLAAASVAGADVGYPGSSTPKWSTLSTRDTVVGGLLLCAAAVCLGLWTVRFPRAATGVVLLVLGLPGLLIGWALYAIEDSLLLGTVGMVVAAALVLGGGRLLWGSGPAFGGRGLLTLAAGLVCLVLGLVIPGAGMEWESPRRPRPPRPAPQAPSDAPAEGSAPDRENTPAGQPPDQDGRR
jgi:hypothetical protein